MRRYRSPLPSPEQGGVGCRNDMKKRSYFGFKFNLFHRPSEGSLLHTSKNHGDLYKTKDRKKTRSSFGMQPLPEEPQTPPGFKV